MKRLQSRCSDSSHLDPYGIKSSVSFPGDVGARLLRAVPPHVRARQLLRSTPPPLSPQNYEEMFPGVGGVGKPGEPEADEGKTLRTILEKAQERLKNPHEHSRERLEWSRFLVELDEQYDPPTHLSPENAVRHKIVYFSREIRRFRLMNDAEALWRTMCKCIEYGEVVSLGESSPLGFTADEIAEKTRLGSFRVGQVLLYLSSVGQVRGTGDRWLPIGGESCKKETPIAVASESAVKGRAVPKPNIPKKPPRQCEYRAWSLYRSIQLTQVEIAEQLTEELKRPVGQSMVSRWISKVDHFQKAGGKSSIAVPNPTRITMDPDKLDLGARRDARTPTPSDLSDSL